MAKYWTKEERNVLMRYFDASDEETMQDTYEYVHHMMYNEGNHPHFPIRSKKAVATRICKEVCINRRK